MNHVNYILKGKPINPEVLIIDRAVLREITTVLSIVISIVGLAVILWMLFAAVIMDSVRWVKVNLYLYKRQKRRLRYIKYVLRSLNVKVTPYHVQLLNAA